MRDARAVVIGAGVGGLAAAIDLACQGVPVTVIERGDEPGGKMRVAPIEDREIDVGPTVFTMRWVFEALFADAGADFAERAPLAPVDLLARHHWPDGSTFDLVADPAQAHDDVARFAGPKEARGFARFRADAAATFEVLWPAFMASQKPSPAALAARLGALAPRALAVMRPFQSLWGALGGYFHDQRLRQLFARYATYCGASPFLAPATLMLIAHAELAGVWRLEGGMIALARALAKLATQRGVDIQTTCAATRIETNARGVCAVWDAKGERRPAHIVVVNADPAALASGLLGPPAQRAVARPVGRSQSAITWALLARTSGFPLAHHTVFFGPDYRAEFDAVFRAGRPPKSPTIYVCAQDRAAAAAGAPDRERLFILANAPARPALADQEIDRCQEAMFARLDQAGLRLEARSAPLVRCDPAGFAQAFPGSEGALYGAPIHSPFAIFRRPGARTSIPGLYLAGGGAHPSAGVPMAALSGRLAAAQALLDLGSTARSNLAAMPGGISTQSATMADMASP